MLKTKIKILLTIVIGALLIFSCQSQKTKSHSDKFITEDITNFYEMFSQLKTATSFTDTLKILNESYLDKGSVGLKTYLEYEIKNNKRNIQEE